LPTPPRQAPSTGITQITLRALLQPQFDVCRTRSHLPRSRARENPGGGTQGGPRRGYKAPKNIWGGLVRGPPLLKAPEIWGTPPLRPPKAPQHPPPYSGLTPYKPYTPYMVRNRSKNPKTLLVMRIQEFFVSRGGGRKFLARKIIYRKLFPHQDHMLTTF
jgi:hypothetical protein